MFYLFAIHHGITKSLIGNHCVVRVLSLMRLESLDRIATDRIASRLDSLVAGCVRYYGSLIDRMILLNVRLRRLIGQELIVTGARVCILVDVCVAVLT